MPQVVDLNVLVRSRGGDGKVVCETLVDPPARPPPPEDDPDLPADSFRLPVEDVINWISRHAASSYDRDGSTRGTTNPKSSSAHHHPNPKLLSLYYANPKGPIIGLPNKLQNSAGFLCKSSRRHGASAHFLIPKRCRTRSQSVGNVRKSATTVAEPTSPKVSCIGRVLTDRDGNLCRKAVRRTEPDVSCESKSSASTGGLTGFWASVLALSCCVPRRAAALVCEEAVSSSRSTPTETPRKITPPGGAVTEETVLAAPAPGLGGMKRFVSGRRTASWEGELEVDVEDMERLGLSPLRRGQRAILPGRRSVGSIADLDGDRNWESEGSASV